MRRHWRRAVHRPHKLVNHLLKYIRGSRQDGCVGYVNHDYQQASSVIVTIDLEGYYEITTIRFNMGNVERAETWGADTIVTPFGEAAVIPGNSYTSAAEGDGAWTELSGNIVASEVIITLEKTRTSTVTDWLFIGEIEVYGIPASSQ
jgi:hypothetical protein